MDAKRIIPVLQVRDGQVVSAEGPVPASTWARRLELEGADGILFRVGAGSGAQWIREVAGTLSIPFTLEAPLRDWAELEEILEAGVDKVVLPASVAADDPLLAAAVGTFGRSRVAVAVNACLAADGRWLVDPADGPQGREALVWMAELEQRGAGEILLSTTPEQVSCSALCQAAARLALSVLWLCPGVEALAADALLHGADGLACLDLERSPNQWKNILGVHGLPFRQ